MLQSSWKFFNMCLLFSIISLVVAINFFSMQMYINAIIASVFSVILFFIMLRNIIVTKKKKKESIDDN